MYPESYERSTRYTLPEAIEDAIHHSPSVSPTFTDVEVDSIFPRTSVESAEPELEQASKDALLHAFGASPIPAQATNEVKDDVRPMSDATIEIGYESTDREMVDAKHARMGIETRDFVTTSSSYSRHANQPPIFCFYAKDALAQVESMLMRGEDRKAPIPPMLLARLIEISWFSQEELLERLHNMDWNQLKVYMEHWDGERKAFVDTHGTRGQWGLNGKGRIGPPYRVVWTRTAVTTDDNEGQKGKAVKVPAVENEKDTQKADPAVAFALNEDHILTRGRPPSSAFRKHLGETAPSLWPWLNKYEALHREQCSMNNEQQAGRNKEGMVVTLRNSTSKGSLKLANALPTRQPTLLDMGSSPAKKDQSNVLVDLPAKEEPTQAPASPPKPPSLKEKVSIWLKVPLRSVPVNSTPVASASTSTLVADAAVTEPEVAAATNSGTTSTTGSEPSAPLKIKISRKRKALEDEGEKEKPPVRKSGRVIKKPKRFTL